MAEKKTGGMAFLANPKSRMMVIGVAVVLVAGIALAVNGMIKKNSMSKESSEPTSTAALPADANKKAAIDPTKVDAQQSDLRKTANEDAAKRAESNGQTFIATMRPDAAPASVASAGNGIDPSMYAARNADNGYARYASAREPSEQDIRDAEAAQQKKVDEWKRKLTADKAKINEAWEPGSRVFYTAYVGNESVQGEKKEKDVHEQQVGKADAQKKGQVFARAGDIFYGSIDIGMNTDEPSAITAYILSGPFKGGKLLGALAGQTAPYSEKAVIQFTSLNHPKFERSIPVKIFAVDRDTKRAAVADNVDRHLLTKFGLAAIVDFAQGYAEGKSQNNSTVIYGQNGSPTVVTQSELNNKQLIARGAAKTMNRVASTLAPYTNRPNTLEVYSQTEIGLLVAADIVYVEGVNADNSGPAPGAATANGARQAAVANSYAPALPMPPVQPPAMYGQQQMYVPQPAYPQPAYGGQPAVYGQIPVYGQR
ncbi:DotG/IcmE/VirB10 family protein [Undibacterium sp. KW1]|uniref:DotG/IcmE/VirB10 family protein n=1 Tax=Undibacterium sp. KW1 TaxID=2058624 RepID=UPI00138A1226|nr:DotG/IcmE/VirB10 family protein [Undibacterium sp. KW1]